MPSKPPASPDSLRRERAGTYRTPDGRFTVEQSSSGWLVVDAEQADELGLPLTRGPYATLDVARAAIPEARISPAPTSGVGNRPPRTAASPGPREASGNQAGSEAKRRQSAPRQPRPVTPPRPARPPVVIREIRAVDGDALRAMWTDAGFRLLGDDDLGLARLARRNPGLVLVAAEGTHIVGSALGAWDGHRGWVYHVATAPSHRRRGIATRLIDEIEAGLRALGCQKVNVMVRDDSDGGAEFWAARDFVPGTATQFSKVIREG